MFGCIAYRASMGKHNEMTDDSSDSDYYTQDVGQFCNPRGLPSEQCVPTRSVLILQFLQGRILYNFGLILGVHDRKLLSPSFYLPGFI